MSYGSKRIALCAMIAATVSLFAQALWIPTAQAQSAATDSGQVVQVPVSQLEQIEKELQYLRAREAERQAWEASIGRQLPVDGKVPVADQSGNTTDAGLVGDQASGTAPCDVCKGVSHGCRCPRCMSTEDAPCVECPRATTRDPWITAKIFGVVKLDAIYNEARPQAPGAPFFLVPNFVGGFPTNTIDINARQSMLGFLFTGPKFGDFQSGGRISAVFFDPTVLADRNGFLLQASYGELFNDDWRFAAGLQFDVFAPGLPTVLPFSYLGGSGSPGNCIRGQIRVERFVDIGCDSQMTLQGALSEPLNTYTIPDLTLDEDNGWPNVEARIGFGFGEPAPIGLLTQRPLEVGLSGLVGQLRRTEFPPAAPRRVISDVWGAAVDFQVNMAGYFGFKGEMYTGQALGNYNGAILQSLDAVTFEAIRSTGGWVEGFVYLTPCLHSHTGIGIDDPDDDDITAIPNNLFGRTYNSTIYSNLLWDLNKSYRIAFELTYRETEYKEPTNLPNSGFGFHTQFAWTF